MFVPCFSGFITKKFFKCYRNVKTALRPGSVQAWWLLKIGLNHLLIIQFRENAELNHRLSSRF